MTSRYLLRLVRKGYNDETAIADGLINEVRCKAVKMLSKYKSQPGSRVQVIRYNTSGKLEVVGEVRYSRPPILGAVYAWATDDSGEFTDIRKDGSLGLKFSLR